jgi:prepilin-type N-terminal cleavage/methylation domain-containing protein
MIVRTPRRKAARSAFTLTEMLVVVAIILALAAIAVPITFSVLDSSKRDIAQAQIKGTLVPAVLRFKNDQANNPGNDLPSSLQDLITNEKAGLKSDQLLDPWANPYQYSQTTSHNSPDGFDIWSTGNGGEPIGNWPKGQ